MQCNTIVQNTYQCMEDLEVEVKDGILSIGETKVREIFNAARILL